ncbi:ABC transporter permease [Flavobacteriaceae bacterium]|jgi:putative ABC transport system permease protein|nr:ABC transporter permease [Flavobacteriaceae bacterium]MDB4147869.1 ABC transporter permease [bacterium]MDA8640920.1 ABC transporter permease [Flavobacteriaceae bacterium]MDA8733781.1 ABC transporter permease [Flavobacteriaceae bacterium]MDA9977673.1 ABC transporter permease [Flavobacteriaceae bacterium]
MKRLFDKDTWQEIFGSIQKNKIRTIITMIGVLWGIFIYIALSGSSKGLDNGFERQFQSIASNSIFVWAQSTSLPYAGYKSERNITLKIQDAEVLKKQVKNIKFIAPRIVAGVFGSAGGSIVRGTKTGTYSVYGEYPEYIKIATSKIYDGGRFINQSDIQDDRKVCVIGERTQLELFEEDEDPIGKFISINKINFRVVGVHKFVQGGGFGDDGDIYIPFTTFKKIFNTGDNVGFFMIAADENADGVKVEKDIKATLKQIHKIDPNDERAIGGFNLGEIFRKTMNFANGLTFLSLVVGIATILAGIIGIGNILLISVKERTKEIGIRRALGATPGEVRSQIILESVFLTILAGVIGIILGALVLYGINAATMDQTDFPYTNPTVPIPYVLGALGLMVLLGTLIGIIPAQRAVSIKPIDALREE